MSHHTNNWIKNILPHTNCSFDDVKSPRGCDTDRYRSQLPECQVWPTRGRYQQQSESRSQKSVNPPFETQRESESGMVTSEIMQKPAPDITSETLPRGFSLPWPGYEASYGASLSSVCGRGHGGACGVNTVQGIVMVIIMREASTDQLTRKQR